ncbi:hypothetical protein MTR67_019883, partial [Solanum verrucosum]
SKVIQCSRARKHVILIWAILAALVYYIWQARNDAVWNQRVPRTQMILQKIQMESKVRIFEILKRKHGCKDRYWIEQLYK